MQQFKTLLTIVAAVAVIGGIVVLGRWARDDLHKSGHFTVKFAELQCPVPPGSTKAQFLGEVQYLGGFADEFSRTQPKIDERLIMAFARHPWVESAGPIQWSKPPKVDLLLRTPVLAVGDRAVDGRGVLLPKTALLGELPKLVGFEKQPAVSSGQPWSEEPIGDASKLISNLRDRVPNIKFASIEKSADGWLLIRPDGMQLNLIHKQGSLTDTQVERIRAWTTGNLEVK